ncbi:MAG: hypothetical protein HOW97_24160 [Catenulispora sp.]|nr:hypothetical protein [Catenulispora sp.]
MFLDEAVSLLPPPDEPFSSDGGAWRDLESALRVRLPGSFKAFADRYGPGMVDDHIRIYHPLAGRFWNLGEEMRERTDAYATIWPQLEFPLTAGTAVGDVLYWGDTDHGIVLFFRIDGDDPDAWPIIEQADDSYEDSELGFGDWLLRYLRGGGSRGHFVRNVHAVDGEPVRPRFRRIVS